MKYDEIKDAQYNIKDLEYKLNSQTGFSEFIEKNFSDEQNKIKSLENKISDLKKDYDRQFWRYVELEKNYNVFVEKTLSRLSVEPDIVYERKFKESEE